MSWILGGAIVGVVVGMFTENVGLWVGIGAGAGVLLFLLRSMSKSGGCCCSGDKPADEDSDVSDTEE